jgi:hypothetical protein
MEEFTCGMEANFVLPHEIADNQGCGLHKTDFLPERDHRSIGEEHHLPSVLIND